MLAFDLESDNTTGTLPVRGSIESRAFLCPHVQQMIVCMLVWCVLSAGPVYNDRDVGHSLYSTHKDEDTPTSITTTDVTTLDGVGAVFYYTKTNSLHISSCFSNIISESLI